MREKQEAQIQLAMRVPESLLARIDKIAERMSQPGMRVTRTEAMRLATFRGVELFEAERKKR